MSDASNSRQRALIIVAHPDDEILWCGGLILLHPERHWDVLALCRGGDADRQPRFFQTMARLGASGQMASLDDGPEQHPLAQEEIAAAVLSHLGDATFDLVLTHSPHGEYTRHLRHEEVSKAVMSLWERKKIDSKALWLFAYEDGRRRYCPRAIEGAHRETVLPTAVWEEKRHIIHTNYGFSTDSWEFRTTPQKEAFWCFQTVDEMHAWMTEHPPDCPRRY